MVPRALVASQYSLLHRLGAVPRADALASVVGQDLCRCVGRVLSGLGRRRTLSSHRVAEG